MAKTGASLSKMATNLYGSPQYLDLYLYCSVGVPFSFRKNLNRWPDFSLILRYQIGSKEDEAVDDLIAALEHPNRVRSLDLYIGSWDSRVYEVLKKLQVRFPALTRLELEGPDSDHDAEVYDISDNFLGNTAPRLQHLCLDGISFQGLPKLLLSTRGLVSLQLRDIPADDFGCYGYISPEAMVGGLAGLASLRALCIEFRSLDERSNPNERLEEDRRLHPPMRPVLPALAGFAFRGDIKYLEDLVTRIDMPSIEDIKIEFYPPWFDIPQLSQFICQTASLELAQFRHAQVTFDTFYHQITLDRPQCERRQFHFLLTVQISELDTAMDSDSDVLLPRMAGLLGQLTALLSNVRHLSLDSPQHWPKEMNPLDNSKLLPLLHLFPTVEELHVSGTLTRHIATALENIAEERVTELMPALRSLQLGDGKEPVGPTERFLSFRRLSGHPVDVVNNNTKDQPEG